MKTFKEYFQWRARLRKLYKQIKLKNLSLENLIEYCHCVIESDNKIDTNDLFASKVEVQSSLFTIECGGIGEDNTNFEKLGISIFVMTSGNIRIEMLAKYYNSASNQTITQIVSFMGGIDKGKLIDKGTIEPHQLDLVCTLISSSIMYTIRTYLTRWK